MADRIETLLTAERRLLQDVSHELRSPLARLSFAAELMKDTRDPEAAASRMRREIKRLCGLVSTLLEVTTAEGDPSSRRTERVTIVPLVDEIVNDCRVEAEARSVRIEHETDGPPAVAVVEGNSELLRRALENVLRNAIRFTPPSSNVLVRLEALHGKVVLRVRDCGPGVPEGMLGRIFDPFFRVDQSRDGGGAGLGLSIARRAVLLHGGEIKAENTNPGLMITISLPSVTSTS
jgi:two-component system sensor histidine kinase CpxA